MKNNVKKMIGLLLIAVMMMGFAACGAPAADEIELITVTDGETIGEGASEFQLVITDAEGQSIQVTVKTDEATVGDALVNLGLNLWWVQIWGIYGVLLSTVASMVFVGMPWVLHNVFTLFFEKAMLRSYVGQLLGHTALTVAAGSIVTLVCSRFRLTPWVDLAACAAVSIAVPNLLFYLALGRTEQFHKALRFVKRIFNRKRKE